MELADQFDLFSKILRGGWITHPPHNPNINGNLRINSDVSISANEMYSPEITCFADIPTSELSLHMEKYSSIGLSFSKEFIAGAGGVPVHYLPIEANVKRSKNLTPEEIQKMIDDYGPESLVEMMDETVPKGQHFDEMLKEYHDLFAIFRRLERAYNPNPGVSEVSKRITELQKFFDFHIFSFFKFFDHRKIDDDPDNFYFEREWRIVGNLQFTAEDVKTVFFPSFYASVFRDKFPQYAGQVIFTD